MTFLLYNYYGEYMKIRLRLWVKLLLISIILLTGFIVYSRYIGTNGIKVKEYPIVNSKIPSNFYGLKIVHISDIHYKVTTTKEELEEIVNEINLLKPDIVILSGDLFNKSVNYTKKDYKNITNVLKKINYNIGKYAIKGDNDLNIKNWEEVITNSDFIDLNNNYDSIYYENNEPILLIGMSSNYKNNHIKKDIDSIYSKTNKNFNYSILVLHEPDFIDDIDYSKFNLILAGHSLNGQIKFPLIGGIIKDKYGKKYYDEYYKLNNTDLYVSGGIGTNKYKFRFNNTPSFNLYRLRNK